MSNKRKRKKKVKLRSILVFFGFFVVTLIIGYYIAVMPIKNIYIYGNKIVTDKQIRELSGLDEYPSFFLTRKKDIKTRLEKNQYIHQVRIEKKWGNIVNLFIKEYQPISLTKEQQIILSNGLKIDNVYDLSDIPVLINSIEDKNVYLNFAKRFELVDSDILRQISEIEYSPVEVDPERFLLYMNDGNLVYVTLTKILKLNRYNNIKDKINGKKGIIYLDAGDYMEVKQ